MDWKKYLKIILILATLGAIIWLGYWFFTKSPAGQQLTRVVFPPSEKTPSEQTEQEKLRAQRFQAVTPAPIFDYWTNTKNNNVYYLNEAGQALSYNNGAEELENSQTLPKLNKLIASPDGTSAIAKFNYPFSTTFSIFNTAAKSWAALPAKTIAVTWSPDSQKIAFVDSASLKIFSPLTQKTEEIIKLSQKDISLNWRAPSEILITFNSDIRTKIYLLNLVKKTLTPFMEDSGLEIKWSDDSRLGIKLNTANNKPITSLVNNNGDSLTQLTFITLPSKCLIKENKIYCAVPKNISDSTKLPMDYYKKSIYFDDTIYLIDLATAGISELKTNGIVIDAEHLEKNNDRLLFKNRLDGKLYGLKLE